MQPSRRARGLRSGRRRVHQAESQDWRGERGVGPEAEGRLREADQGRDEERDQEPSAIDQQGNEPRRAAQGLRVAVWSEL